MQETVAVAAIGLAATTVAALVWAMKYFAKNLTKALEDHTKAAYQQQQASKASAEASRSLEITVRKVGEQAELSSGNSVELLTFMRNLNGKFQKVAKQKIAEQTIDHQTIKEQTVEHTEDV